MSQGEKVPLLLESVDEFRDAGYSLIPVRPRGKEPLTEALIESTRKNSVNQFRKKPPTGEEVGSWFYNHFYGQGDKQTLNVAVLTGVNGLIVIDVDSEVIPKSLQNSSTTVVRTSRGYHFYFSLKKKHLLRQDTCIIDGVRCELKADGCYVIIPGSVHESGATYEFIRGLGDLKPLPPAIIRQLSPDNQATLAGKKTILKGTNLPCVRTLMYNPIQVGERDKKLFLLFRLLLQNGASKDSASGAIRQRNRLLASPFTERELQQKFFGSTRTYHFSCDGVVRWAPDLKNGCSSCPTRARYLRDAVQTMRLDKVSALSPSAVKVWVVIQDLRSQGKLGKRHKREFAKKECHLAPNTLDNALKELDKGGFDIPGDVFKK